MATMKSVTRKGSRLKQLQMLANVLAENIDSCDDNKTLPQLAKQYRETIKEIEELEGVKDDDDEISKVLAARQRDGKPGAVRKDCS